MEEPQGLELRGERERAARVARAHRRLELRARDADRRRRSATPWPRSSRSATGRSGSQSRSTAARSSLHASWILASTERVARGLRYREHLGSRPRRRWPTAGGCSRTRYPGRFVLGVGVSHARFGRPTRQHATRSRTRRCATTCDAMDRAPSSAAEPEVTPRLVLAALGPKMLELAAETRPRRPSLLRSGRAHGVRAAAASVRVRCSRWSRRSCSRATRPRLGDVARGSRWTTCRPRTTRGTSGACGWTDADVAGQGSDALIDAVVAWGDVDRIAVRVRQHLDAGADHVCVQVVSEDELDPCLPAAPGARARAARAVGQRRLQAAWTASLRSSRRTSRAIHLEDRASVRSICSAVRIAFVLNGGAALADLPQRPGDRLLHEVAVVGRPLADQRQQRARTPRRAGPCGGPRPTP